MPECQKAGFGLSYWLECRRVRPESCGFRVGPIETRSSERCSTTDHVGVMGDLSIAYQRRCWFGVAEGFAWTPVCATIWARVEPMVDLQARCSTAHYRGLRKHSTMGIEERLEREKYWWKYVCEWVPRRARCEFDSRALLYVPCLSLDRAQGRYPYGNGIRCTASRPREWGSNGLAPWAEPWTHRSSGDSL